MSNKKIELIDCYLCGGTGTWGLLVNRCPVCHGKGKIRKNLK